MTRKPDDEVLERLERLAAQAGMSASSVPIRELAEASRRADDPRLLAVLPHRDIAPSGIVEGVDAERSARRSSWTPRRPSPRC